MRKTTAILMFALALTLGFGTLTTAVAQEAGTAMTDTYRGDDNDTDWGWIGLLGLAGLLGLRRREHVRTDTAARTATAR